MDKELAAVQDFFTTGLTREAAVSSEYVERYDQLERYIARDEVKCAFRALLDTDRYHIYPNLMKPAVNFRDGVLPLDPIPYAFIVNKQWLNFYVRKPAFDSWQPHMHVMMARYGASFDPAQRKSNEGTPEWRIRLACVDDVEFLYGVCPAVPYPLVRRA